MPAYETPEAITATIEFEMGSLRITAGKRPDTVVEVRPTTDDKKDVQAAEQTKVSCSGGRLTVTGPNKRSLFGKSASLDITVELPAGSEIRCTSPMVNATVEGEVAGCRIQTSMGDIRVESAATVHLKTGHGDIWVGSVAGDAEVRGSGQVRVGRIGGAATVKNSNGESAIDEVVGELRVGSSNGSVVIGLAHASVEAKSASGSVRIGEVVRGKVTLRSSAGNIGVGIREATAAWLDVHTGAGAVRNSLGPSDGPGAAENTVEVRAHTAAGDIEIHRA
ncbi:DUF4097 family beta strand repeat-containing protein [Streptomyces fulvorobeus]|uniref:DUF4097 and DUF4098 domain-containing protein YvlB n=1 Tax=Streptomyces fulvorobeus TaxID=284028 RepID=A0A7J0CA02_9ACTN|nr:DUF4097 family beta strand repeat-containing protein [Streptomyces fulvorobeus]NYE42911.1 DUF4097 and DUF4098 domain-containing protein YvlB [Streptomyces fulvorobeus]GFM99339.1 hypothetical protein Sfulv_41500 [Streptomyces fulvorobeus]